jgi:hypothetical protein
MGAGNLTLSGVVAERLASRPRRFAYTARVKSRIGADRVVVGTLLIALGVAALVEARRLHALREAMVAGAVVGDDTFPLIVGVGMVVLGVLCLTVRMPSAGVTLPTGTVRARMLGSGALLAAYWAILPSVGYTLSTAVVSIGLYRSMGGYRWPVAIAAAAVTTVVLHLLFRVWLRQPLPGGWLGI